MSETNERRVTAFVSHADHDKNLAQAWVDLVLGASNGRVRAWAASSPDSGVSPGEKWRENVLAKLNQASVIICLLTPTSLSRPWVAFECGVGEALECTIYPVVFDIEPREVKEPFSNRQAAHALDRKSVERVILQILEDEGVSATNLERHLDEYMESAEKAYQSGRESLLQDPHVTGLIGRLQIGIEAARADSIMKGFVINELDRIATRVELVERGEFELRNERPPDEVIEYYSRYLEQLSGKGCQYYTVSTREFWLAITNQGESFGYQVANELAAQRIFDGQIKRVFLLDLDRYPDKQVPGSDPLASILEAHLSATKKSQGAISTRVLFSRDYKRDLKTYQNFAVWKRGVESVLILPEYRDGGGDREQTMTRTKFLFARAGEQAEWSKENLRRIEESIQKCSILHEQAHELEPRHFSCGD